MISHTCEFDYQFSFWRASLPFTVKMSFISSNGYQTLQTQDTSVSEIGAECPDISALGTSCNALVKKWPRVLSYLTIWYNNNITLSMFQVNCSFFSYKTDPLIPTVDGIVRCANAFTKYAMTHCSQRPSKPTYSVRIFKVSNFSYALMSQFSSIIFLILTFNFWRFYAIWALSRPRCRSIQRTFRNWCRTVLGPKCPVTVQITINTIRLVQHYPIG